MADLDDPRRLDRFGLHLTDGSHDALLDSFIRRVTERAGAPVALLSLVMGRIQLFRASAGLPPDLERSRATSRSASFCQLVVKAENELIVNDAAADPRVPKDAVDAYSVGAYIGVPLRHDGEVIGSLCAIDSAPRQWDPTLARDLKVIAAELEERLEALRESKDQEDAVAIPNITLGLMLGALVSGAEAIEGPVARAGEILRSEAWLTAPGSAGETGGPARELTDLIQSLEEPVGQLRRSALRIADAIELRRLKTGSEHLEPLRLHARALGRSLSELGPVARLIDGASSGAISAEDFAKNARLLTETEASAGDMLTSLRGLIENGNSLGAVIGIKL